VFVWVVLPDGWSTAALLERAIEHGMFFMPGTVFLAGVPDDQSLRLSISNHTPESIAEGLSRLGRAIEAVPTAVT
jgi:2-aminoadipate transaminase